MAEYIEREAAIDAIDEALKRVFVLPVGKSIVDRIPAADVREVVKATWKRIDFNPCGHDYECSSCGWKNDMATHFCPNCGARMEES